MVSDVLDKKGFVSLSARCQNGKVNLNDILKKATGDFNNCTVGGHIQAAGGVFLKKDVKKFKENLLREFRKNN